MLRATNFATALLSAAVKDRAALQGRGNWVARAVIDRAQHTTTGNVNERDHVHLSYKTREQLGLSNK